MRRSVAFWRMRPDAKVRGSALPPAPAPAAAAVSVEEGLGFSRWDSEMRRRSSRSWASSEGASSGRDEGAVAFVCDAGVVEEEGVEEWSGGRDDCW